MGIRSLSKSSQHVVHTRQSFGKGSCILSISEQHLLFGFGVVSKIRSHTDCLQQWVSSGQSPGVDPS